MSWETTVPPGTFAEDCGMDHQEEPPTTDLVKTFGYALTGPAHEQLVILDTIAKMANERARVIKEKLLDEMDGSYKLDAFDTHTVQKVKAPAKWHYVFDETLSGLQAQADTIDLKLKERQKFMQEGGGAVDQNEGQYLIRITEKKLTKEKIK